MTEVLRSKHERSLSCAGAVQAFLDRVQRIEPTLHGFRQIEPERLFAEAAILDAQPAETRGPLHGQLIAVKEVFDVAGYTCGWGTPIHDGRKPEEDCATVAALRGAGAIVAGITVSSEYAMSSVGPTVNPFDKTRTPGASSQGSAAVVGAGLVDMALGSQTIGSIIRPASYCGCIGFKPTWGSIDVSGTMPLSAPLDHVGFMASTLQQAETLLAQLAPALPETRSVVPPQVLNLEPRQTDDIHPEMRRVVAQALAKLGKAGVEVVPFRLPEWIAETEESVLDTILAHDVAHHHGADYNAHANKMSDRIQDYITRGQLITKQAYLAALSQRDKMIGELRQKLAGRPVLAPSAIGIAPLLAEGTGSRAPQRLWTLTGFPAISVPFGSFEGMPLGVQIIASPGEDRLTIDTARMLIGKA